MRKTVIFLCLLMNIYGLSQSEVSKELFPTLSGLQRTGCTKTIGENENGTVWGSRSYLMQEIETATIDRKQYLLFGINDMYSYDEYCSLWLREENNKILVYSTAQKKDLVLYDFTLNVGDSLPRLYVDYDLSSVVDYDNDEWGLSPLVVTEISTITLLDGKEYKKWTFDNGMEYVEGIGSFGSCYAYNDFYQLIANAPLYSDVHSQHLICASRNGQLLYQMDEEKMDSLGVECLCKAIAKDWCNQWNMLSHMSLHDATTWIYQLGKDTIINHLMYSKLNVHYSKDENVAFYIGAVRFTNDKKVYIHYEDAEYLLYDFNVQVGDVIEVFSGIQNYGQTHTYTHTITDVTPREDGRLLVESEIELKDDNHTIKVKKQWIEGIGSTDGITHNVSSLMESGVHQVLLCAYHDDECMYTTDDPKYMPLGCIYNGEDSSNAVGNTSVSQSSATKIIKEGQLLILRDSKTYNVMGVEVGE